MDMPPATFWHSTAEPGDFLQIDNESRPLGRLRARTGGDCLEQTMTGPPLLQIFQAAA
jgi:hypothetical protein